MIFDKGANRIAHTQMIRADNLQNISGKKLNKSDDKIIADIEVYNFQVIDEESGICGIKIENLNSINYLYFSKSWNSESERLFVRKGSKSHSGEY